VHDKIMESVSSDDGGFFFLYSYGGTGKTYIWKTLSAVVRSKGLIVLNAIQRYNDSSITRWKNRALEADSPY
jgi:hypothetical protein